ncbi:hypothetical protein Hypma_001387 [Hypsizygus marmoreus]|uniref:Uncharacterized protein n=1 Tax=Hypsizygus marmoreus TaxID=39966 RepID=A0A369K8Z3_HYPMA|nr:hypothetical protein Hypma_001387 [Hypsizygus marmoreus]
MLPQQKTRRHTSNGTMDSLERLINPVGSQSERSIITLHTYLLHLPTVQRLCLYPLYHPIVVRFLWFCRARLFSLPFPPSSSVISPQHHSIIMNHSSFPFPFTFHVPLVHPTNESAFHPNLSHPDQPLMQPLQVAQNSHGLTASGGVGDVDGYPVARILPPVIWSHVTSGTAAPATQNPMYPSQGRFPTVPHANLNALHAMELRANNATHQALAGQSGLAHIATTPMASQPMRRQMRFIPYVPPATSTSKPPSSQNTSALLPGNTHNRKYHEQDVPNGLEDNVPAALWPDATFASNDKEMSQRLQSKKTKTAPEKKGRSNRSDGTCPFCGKRLSRSDRSHIMKHLGLNKDSDNSDPCRFFTREGGGVVLYSLHGLTKPLPVEVKIWYMYPIKIADEPIGPGRRAQIYDEKNPGRETIKGDKMLRMSWLNDIKMAMEALQITLPPGEHPETLEYPHGRSGQRRTIAATGSTMSSQHDRMFSSQQHDVGGTMASGRSTPTLDWGSTTGSPSEPSTSSLYTPTPPPAPHLPLQWLQQDVPLHNPAIEHGQQLNSYTREGLHEHEYAAHPKPMYPVQMQGWYIEPRLEQVPVRDNHAVGHYPEGGSQGELQSLCYNGPNMPTQSNFPQAPLDESQPEGYDSPDDYGVEHNPVVHSPQVDQNQPMDSNMHATHGTAPSMFVSEDHFRQDENENYLSEAEAAALVIPQHFWPWLNAQVAPPGTIDPSLLSLH